MFDANNIQQSPAVREKNIRLALAAVANVPKEDLPILFVSLLRHYKRVQLDLALDTAQRMIGQTK